MREQATISDKQFLKSTISHHAGAILMCGEHQALSVQRANEEFGT
jgi:uncharacterized protein (DUF305 family)